MTALLNTIEDLKSILNSNDPKKELEKYVNVLENEFANFESQFEQEFLDSLRRDVFVNFMN
jgi:hypothetical protein